MEGGIRYFLVRKNEPTIFPSSLVLNRPWERVQISPQFSILGLIWSCKYKRWQMCLVISGAVQQTNYFSSDCSYRLISCVNSYLSIRQKQRCLVDNCRTILNSKPEWWAPSGCLAPCLGCNGYNTWFVATTLTGNWTHDVASLSVCVSGCWCGRSLKAKYGRTPDNVDNSTSLLLCQAGDVQNVVGVWWDDRKEQFVFPWLLFEECVTNIELVKEIPQGNYIQINPG